MADRRTTLLDAAIEVLGRHGARGLTHRAVDEAAGCPPGSTSNYFRTRDALLAGVVTRFATRENEVVAQAARLEAATAAELARALADLAHLAVGANRTLTLARYVVLVEGARSPSLQAVLREAGRRVGGGLPDRLRRLGSRSPELHTWVVQNLWTGLVLHQLARPDPSFDPYPQLEALLTALVAAGSAPAPEEVR